MVSGCITSSFTISFTNYDQVAGMKALNTVVYMIHFDSRLVAAGCCNAVWVWYRCRGYDHVDLSAGSLPCGQWSERERAQCERSFFTMTGTDFTGSEAGTCIFNTRLSLLALVLFIDCISDFIRIVITPLFTKVDTLILQKFFIYEVNTWGKAIHGTTLLFLIQLSHWIMIWSWFIISIVLQ